MFNGVYNSIFNCLNSATASLSRAQQAHAHILKLGLFNNTPLANKLLSLYVNHQCLSEANLVLVSLPNPNSLSFATLIVAFSKFNCFDHVLRVFSQMISRGLMPDGHVLPSVSKACGGLHELKVGKQIHAIAYVSGSESGLTVQLSLVYMYLKFNRIQDAHKLFDKMPEKDTVIWSAMIASYSRLGCLNKAKELFSEMRNAGVQPNLISWNGIIAGFNQSKLYSEAVMLFQEMCSEGFKPDGCTVSSVLPAVGNLEDLVLGIQFHGLVIKHGLRQDQHVTSALIDMYGKCASTLEMSQVFDEVDEMEVGSCNAFITGLSRNGLADTAMEVFRQFKHQGIKLNVVSWTSIVSSCSQNGKDIEALELFREMQANGVEPNSVTTSCLLPACGNIASIKHGKAIHCFSLRKGISDDVYVSSALVDMYAKCGKIKLSRECFNKMRNRNLVSWNTIMSGYAMHGKAKDTIELFCLMLKTGQKPDFISFMCILSACSQNGLTEEGWYYFDSMSRDHGILARMEHYACMVTLLSRAGKIEEAYSLIHKMPFEPDACIWGALLSSCRVHHNVNIGEVAAEKLFKLEPENPGNYILLSNIYASKGMWGEVDRVRGLMKSMGLRKNPGCSWIELGNKMHMLLAGDTSNPQMIQILEKLDKLNIEMKKSGYLPHTDFVLQDVEEQDKEQMLCGHSEKLAVVLGLLNSPPGSPLQVIKNLRICGDCHAVIKFISSFEGREISVRDTNRFHHFTNGVCSCGDYW